MDTLEELLSIARRTRDANLRFALINAHRYLSELSRDCNRLGITPPAA